MACWEHPYEHRRPPQANADPSRAGKSCHFPCDRPSEHISLIMTRTVRWQIHCSSSVEPTHPGYSRSLAESPCTCAMLPHNFGARLAVSKDTAAFLIYPFGSKETKQNPQVLPLSPEHALRQGSFPHVILDKFHQLSSNTSAAPVLRLLCFVYCQSAQTHWVP